MHVIPSYILDLQSGITFLPPEIHPLEFPLLSFAGGTFSWFFVGLKMSIFHLILEIYFQWVQNSRLTVIFLPAWNVSFHSPNFHSC